MLCLNQVPYRLKCQEMLLGLIFLMLSLHFGLMNRASSASSYNCPRVCICSNNMTVINCSSANLTSVPKDIPKTATYLNLRNMQIRTITVNDFSDLRELRQLLFNPSFHTYVEPGSFRNLQKLRQLSINGANIESIEKLSSLENLNISSYVFRHFRDDILFLPNISNIQFFRQIFPACDCYLPALLKYKKKMNQKDVKIIRYCNSTTKQKSRLDQPRLCQNYSLFRKGLSCQECSGIKCTSMLVTKCPGTEPVCMSRTSMSGVTLKIEKSCSTSMECIKAKRNNPVQCNEWENGTSCVSCCGTDICNWNDVGWTHTFPLNLIFTMEKDFSGDLVRNRSKSYHDLAKNISKVLEQEFLKLKGTYFVKVDAFIAPKLTANITISCTVLLSINQLQVWDVINNILNTSKSLDYLNIQRDTIRLTSKNLCNENTISSKEKGTFHWPVTKPGTTVGIPCKRNDGEATRSCLQMFSARDGIGNPVNQADFIAWRSPDMFQCYNIDWIAKELQEINSFIFQSNTPLNLYNISRYNKYFQVKDIVLSVGIVEALLPQIATMSTSTTTNYILPTINNIINCSQEELIKAELSNQSARRILNILETVLDKIQLEEEQLTDKYSNLGIGVVKVDKDNFNGLFYVIEDNMIYNISLGTEQNTITGQNETYISLPKSLLKHLTLEEQLTISRISFYNFYSDKLYRVIQISDNDSYSKQFINSQIISTNILNIQVTDLDEPVVVSFSLLNQNGTNPKCVYWDDTSEQNPHWSTEGCHIFTIVPGKRAVCSCNHLTSFALLMDVYQNEGNHEKPLSIISNIGCGISCVFLVLTIIIHVFSKILRKGIFSKILINLCCSLALANLIFLVGMQAYATKEIIVCKAVAAILQYFLLASLMWMAVEAFHIYLSVVVVFKTNLTYYMMKSLIFAWGLPAIIVILTLAINKTNNYIRIAEVCWLTQTSFYAAFLFPVVIILLFNFTIFCCILWRLISMQNMNAKKFEHKARKLRLFGIVGVIFLLGLSWILAFFAYGGAATVFKYLFAIFNTLQGLFIFIFYCLYKKDARDVLYTYICSRKKDDMKKGTNYKTNIEESSKIKEHGIQSRSRSDSANETTDTNIFSSDDGKVDTKL